MAKTSSTPNLRRASVLAMKLLLRLKTVHLPIDPLTMARRIPHVRTMAYPDYAVYTGMGTAPLQKISDYGYTMRQPGGRAMILYNTEQPPEAIRFTVAHELGHLILSHRRDDGPADEEADYFARCLICPLPVADALHLTNSDAYGFIFSVTDDLARLAFSCRDTDRQLLDNNLYHQVRNMFQSAMADPTPMGLHQKRSAVQ